MPKIGMYTSKMKILGIDETNHGCWPEIYVGVGSMDPALGIRNDAFWNNGKHFHTIEEILAGDEYRIIKIDEAEQKRFSANGIKAIIIIELTKYFAPEREIFDGHVNNKIRGYAEIGLYPNELHEFIAQKRADKNIPVVIKADRIASILYKNYIKSGKNMEDHEDYILKPNFEEYSFIEKLIMEQPLGISR